MKLRRPWTEEDDRALAQAVSAGISMRSLCARLKRHETTIRARAKILGLKIKPTKRLLAVNRGVV